MHSKTQCESTDDDGQCTKFAVYLRTKCAGHMPRKQCRHGKDNAATQCRAAANLGTVFCGIHRREESEAAAAAAAASGKGKSDGTGHDDGGPTKRKRTSKKGTPRGSKRMRGGGLTPVEREAGELAAKGMPSLPSNADAVTSALATAGRTAAATTVVERAAESTPSLPSNADAVTSALATVGRNAAATAVRNSNGKCLVSTCFLSSRGHFLCREHSGLYRCTAQTASGAACKMLTDSTTVRRTCAAHAESESKEKMTEGGSTISSGKSTRSDSGGGGGSNSSGGVKLVACAFSSDTGVKCTRNGEQVVGEPYCKRHYVFTHLRTTLVALEHLGLLDQSRLPGREAQLTTNKEKMNWGAAVANKLGHLKPDGTIRV
jgi:hypothetical protein